MILRNITNSKISYTVETLWGYGSAYNKYTLIVIQSTSKFLANVTIEKFMTRINNLLLTSYKFSMFIAPNNLWIEKKKNNRFELI